MLKAVRFDLETHKHLLDYIDNYRDSKGKPNHSEAIRMLMEKGYEAIHTSPVVEPKIEVQPVDVDSIKDQVYSDIMEELTKKFFSQMGNQPAPIIQSVQPIVQPVIKQTEPIKRESTPLPPPPGPPLGGNALLANLLGNASR